MNERESHHDGFPTIEGLHVERGHFALLHRFNATAGNILWFIVAVFLVLAFLLVLGVEVHAA